MQIKNILVTLALALPILVFSQSNTKQYHNFTSIVPLNKQSWYLEESTLRGNSTRINLTKAGQDPFPFCFSAAATNLWDQHRCSVDKLDCKTQERTSLLAVTPAGQRLSSNMINLTKGGIPILSLAQIVENGGAVSHGSCNYEFINDYRESQNKKIYSIMSNLRDWKKYSPYTPYMARMYRSLLVDNIISLNPLAPAERIQSILNNHPSIAELELFSTILTNPACVDKPKKPDWRFEIKIKDVGMSPETTEVAKLIEEKLTNKIPVMVNLCLFPETGNRNCTYRHTTVIVAQAHALNKTTMERRTYYWLANTWGEDWAAVTSDGWVESEKFLSGVHGQFIWLENKKK